MEAATPLFSSDEPPSIRALGDRLAIEHLVVEDAVAARLARERLESGQNPAKLVGDAIAIGARVLDREQTGANADFVRAEFEKVSGEVQAQFAEQATAAADQLNSQLDTIFDAESGVLMRALNGLFAEDSAGAVQHRVQKVVAETAAHSREEMLKLFTSSEGHNPLAEFKAGVDRTIVGAQKSQERALQGMREQIGALQSEIQRLQAEADKSAAVGAERERGTAKGRAYEEQVAEALDVLALAQGDICTAVGDVRGTTDRKGDVVSSIHACAGPPVG